MSYVAGIINCRHFWIHLAKSELRSRFRYSRLGILWALVQPLMTTVLYTAIFGSIFKRPVMDFSIFIFSGLITWELISGAIMSGSFSLLSAESYIRQRRLPYAIYPLRTSVVIFTLFLIAFTGLAIWAVSYKPQNFGWAWLTLIPSFAILFSLVWPIAIIAAFFQTKFRDFQQVMVLVTQAVYFLSPIFLDPEMFKSGNLTALIDYNPVAHLLNLVREPLLNGQCPPLIDYGWALGTVAVFAMVASWKIWWEERTLIFYF